MNFEFKSTFNKYFKSSYGVSRLHRSTWIFLVNASSTTVVISLYLSNRLIPATIVSRPHGMEYLALACFAITVKIISTIYSGFLTLTTQFDTRSPAVAKSLTSTIAAIRERTALLLQRYVYPSVGRIFPRLSRNHNTFMTNKNN